MSPRTKDTPVAAASFVRGEHVDADANLERQCPTRTFWCAPPIGWATRSCRCRRCARFASAFPDAEISILAKPWVADLYRREPFCDRLIPYTAQNASRKSGRCARNCAGIEFDCAILLQNAFEAAAVAYLAGIPERIGYARDGRSLLLTRADRRAAPRRDSAA